MIEAVRAFLTLLRTPQGHDGSPIEALAAAIDRIVIETHGAAWDGVEIEAPGPVEYEEALARISGAFPSLGMYPTVALPADEEPGLLMADAIEDLVDLERELSLVVWRWENIGPEDAAPYFRYGYRMYWGYHLHQLRLHLYTLQQAE